MDCRVCWTAVKKSAQFCQGCYLICHSRCIADAPSICDVEQQVRANAEHSQRQAASSPILEPRGRIISMARRSAPAAGGTQTLSSSAPPPISFMTAWRKSRNSTSTLATSDGVASAPATPHAGGDHVREPSSESNLSQNTSLRSSGTTSSSANTGRSSSILPSDVDSNGFRTENRDQSGGAMSPMSIDVSSSQAPSPVPGNSLPRNTPAPDEPKTTGTQSNRLKRKPKGADSGTSCIMQ